MDTFDQNVSPDESSTFVDSKTENNTSAEEVQTDKNILTASNILYILACLYYIEAAKLGSAESLKLNPNLVGIKPVKTSNAVNPQEYSAEVTEDEETEMSVQADLEAAEKEFSSRGE